MAMDKENAAAAPNVKPNVGELGKLLKPSKPVDPLLECFKVEEKQTEDSDSDKSDSDKSDSERATDGSSEASFAEEGGAESGVEDGQWESDLEATDDEQEKAKLLKDASKAQQLTVEGAPAEAETDSDSESVTSAHAKLLRAKMLVEDGS